MVYYPVKGHWKVWGSTALGYVSFGASTLFVYVISCFILGFRIWDTWVCLAFIGIWGELYDRSLTF